VSTTREDSSKVYPINEDDKDLRPHRREQLVSAEDAEDKFDLESCETFIGSCL
jgi:hypothetical protein